MPTQVHLGLIYSTIPPTDKYIDLQNVHKSIDIVIRLNILCIVFMVWQELLFLLYGSNRRVLHALSHSLTHSLCFSIL